MSNPFFSSQVLMEKDFFHLEPQNRRIKVYELPEGMNERQLQELEKVAVKEGCDKIIFYVEADQDKVLRVEKLSFQYEGEIQGFYRGEDAFIYAKYLNRERNTANPENVISAILKMEFRFNANKDLPDGYTARWAKEEDAEEMAELYKKVFPKYPTPINKPEYIKEMMDDQVYFSLIHFEGELVSACSADVFSTYQAAEFTDCATHPSHRGKGLLSYQYPILEEKMKEEGIQTMFSYTRAVSMGMNIITAQQGFTYGGCLVQNSTIGNGLEDMNIWYKSI
ncbi:putative beta-lysine N-acetyltransferase [Halobacillus litoralis]|uniref:putative beta-lysine N-acetyltransferase n=1 Tax=Halobacillus litoralis TaxID=45668 RepID=UPI001CFEF9EE|nr:putative beta-lysine N-acetyltransferase [Halobacillus litoralis]